MDKISDKNLYSKTINDITVTGATYQEFVINYLTSLVEQYKDLDKEARLVKYIEHFLHNFKYNKTMREDILAKNEHETFETNEQRLFNLLYKGEGVCMQFSQALSLLSLIDWNITKDAILINLVTNRINVNGKKMGHAINIINSRLVIDISSMLHSQDGDYNQESYSFGLVNLEEYIDNIAKENIKIIPTADTESETYMAGYKLLAYIDKYYKFINLPTDELMSKHFDKLYRLDLPNQQELKI